jgi:DNA-binding transcriptional LysR family regulator
MELRHLRYFIAVAEEGHITRAAERLGMQQPPLSRQIRELERELDVQLFRRIARGVELTDAGRAFLDGARATFANLELSSETARRTARGEKGVIFLGYPGAAAFHPLVPRIIREFRAAFPLVSVKTTAEGFPDDLVEPCEMTRSTSPSSRPRLPSRRELLSICCRRTRWLWRCPADMRSLGPETAAARRCR